MYFIPKNKKILGETPKLMVEQIEKYRQNPDIREKSKM
jgi:hypothetical protein